MQESRHSVKPLSEENIQRLFGHEAAEDESPERLKEYYFKGNAYDSMRADLSLRILVGHKGIGKSALFTVAQQEDAIDKKLSIAIKPDDITELDISEADFNKQIKMWKTGLTRIIQRRVFERLGLGSAPANLHEVPGKILVCLADTLKPYLQNRVDLQPTERSVLGDFLKSNSLTVYLDDLDRGWQGSTNDVRRISALLNAVRDLGNGNSGLRFRVALRTDVYFLVRTSDESTDKLESSVIWYSWTNHEILMLLAKRVVTFFDKNADTTNLSSMSQEQLAAKLSPVMVTHFTGKGKWSNIPVHRMLMTMVRKRPRDMVKLCTLAARKAREAGNLQIQSQISLLYLKTTRKVESRIRLTSIELSFRT